MPASELALLYPTATRRLSTAALGMLALGVGVLAAVLLGEGLGRFVVAATLFGVMAGTAFVRPAAGAVMVVGYLMVLGELRRLLIPFLGWSGQDPLLLVAPGVLAVLLAGVLLRGRVRLDTPMAKLVLVLSAVMVLQMFNPRQGGLAVGVAGALFYLIPISWYWVGRAYASPRALDGMLYGVVVPLATVAAVMGLYQTYFGLLPHQAAWVTLGGYEALSLGGHIRAFSIFPSAAEYAHVVGVAVVLIWAALLRRSRPVLAVLLPILGWALFVAGTRTIVVMVLLACAALWAAQGTSWATWVPRFALAIALAVIGLGWVLSGIGGGEGTASVAMQHQAEGLRNPFDAEHSTAGTHLGLFVGGIAEGFRNPLGHGLGATTNAAGAFGVAGLGTERDLSNLFVSLGLGGLLYAGLIGLVLWRAVRLWVATRHRLALALLGLLGVQLFLWLYGGHYALVTILWLSIGMVDAFHRDLAAPASSASADAPRPSHA